MDTLDLREVADDFGEGPGNGREFAGPVGEFVGPAEPGGGVGFPFGGHAAAQRRGARCSVGLSYQEDSLRRKKWRVTSDEWRAKEEHRRGTAGAGEAGGINTRTLFAEPAVGGGLVGVDAAVAEERPVAASVFAFRWVAFHDENFFFVIGGLGDDLAEGIGDEGMAPEFETRVALFGLAFEADAIDDGGGDAVSDSVRALNGFPGVELGGAELRFFARMPADAGGIEDYLSAAERGEAGAFGIPLVPADLHADARVPGVEIGKTKIAGGEIEFFVIEGIVGNVHLAIFAEEAAVGVEHGYGVVIDAGGAAFEKRDDQRYFALFGYLGKFFRGGTGDGFGEIEKVGVFGAAEIFAVK